MPDPEHIVEPAEFADPPETPLETGEGEGQPDPEKVVPIDRGKEEVEPQRPPKILGEFDDETQAAMEIARLRTMEGYLKRDAAARQRYEAEQARIQQEEQQREAFRQAALMKMKEGRGFEIFEDIDRMNQERLARAFEAMPQYIDRLIRDREQERDELNEFTQAVKTDPRFEVYRGLEDEAITLPDVLVRIQEQARSEGRRLTRGDWLRILEPVVRKARGAPTNTAADKERLARDRAQGAMETVNDVVPAKARTKAKIAEDQAQHDAFLELLGVPTT